MAEPKVNSRKRISRLVDEVRRLRPEDDAAELIRAGLVLVSGVVSLDPELAIRRGVAVTVLRAVKPRGEEKLSNAITRFRVPVSGRVALDAGAAAGGFTRALLNAGAARVYAVDAGHGQLIGSLRQDSRVVNLEATNLGQLSRDRVPDEIELITLDLSYLALSEAVPQLENLRLAADALLLALVKPMFELHLSEPPSDQASLQKAVELASAGISASGWRVTGDMRSPMTGRRGAIEFFVYATRVGGP